MVDIAQLSIFGYTVTPWLIVFCLCIISTIVLAVAVAAGFSKRSAKELKMIEAAAKNTANIPVENTEKRTADFEAEVWGNTEVIADNNAETENVMYSDVCGDTEVMDFSENKTKPKFCSYCGNKASGNFCSCCGHEIN